MDFSVFASFPCCSPFIIAVVVVIVVQDEDDDGDDVDNVESDVDAAVEEDDCAGIAIATSEGGVAVGVQQRSRASPHLLRR